MSHVATIDIEVRDLDVLDAACRRLGLKLVRGQQTYRWFGTSVGDYPLPAGFTAEDLGKCEHAIRLQEDAGPDLIHESYEIGLVRRKDGKPGWQLLWDFFAGGYGLEERVGQGCGRLKQAYANATAIQTAQRSGFRVQEQVLANGTIRLTLQK